MKKIWSIAMIFLVVLFTFTVCLPKVLAADYPHDPRGEITNIVIYPSLPSYQGETPLIYVEFRNPTSTTYHYLVAVNIFDPVHPYPEDPIYDSHVEGEDIDGYVSGGETVSWGPWEYTIPYDAAVGTWHILAGLRLYPWDPELDYMGLSWCEPEKTFIVKPSHETITNKVGGPYDFDSDGYYDSVWIEVKAGTNAEEDVDVEVYGNLTDPDGNVVYTDGSGVWTVPAGGESWGFRFYLLVPSGSPVGRYSVDLYLYDDSHRNTYPEHIWINAYPYDPLYPPGYGSVRTITVDPNGGKIYVDGEPTTTTTQYSWNIGSSHTLDPDSGYSPSTGTKLLFQQWNDGNTEDPRSITVTEDATYTAQWNTQFNVTFQQSGCGGPAHVTIDSGSPNTLPYSTWMDTGSSHNFIFESPVIVGGDQWFLTSTSHSSPITVTGPTTVTGYYSLTGEIELCYDDGIADEGYAPTVGLYTYAVHFQTPTATASYKLGKVKYYIYSDPASFYVDIRNASLQQLYYELATPTQTGWFIVDLTSQEIFVQSDFYVGMKYSQLHEPELGADYTNPDDESGEGLSFPTPNLSSLDWMIRAVLGGKTLDINHQVQRKDTDMLCLGWGSNGSSYDGQLAWDRPHPTNLTHETGSLLDDKYCARASVSMITSYYGGNLSQDRISYYYFEEWSGSPHRDGKPEGDLGCGSGMWGEDVLSWALNGAALTYHNGKPSFINQIKLWIDQNRPIYICYIWYNGSVENRHAMVIDGYDLYGEKVHVLDPWNIAGSGLDKVWVSYNDFESIYQGSIEKAVVPQSGATGRSDETTIWMDSDSDGICDFDEIYRFGTDPDNFDTDGDDVHDKEEIISYTFLSDPIRYDANDLRKPDPDNDNNRCELDDDSDNGGVSDGQEDENGNGFFEPALGETDPLNPSDDPIPNSSPTIDSFTPTDTTPEVNEGSSLEFTHTSSDPDSDPLTYSWLLDSVEQSTAQNWTYSPDYDDAGTHNVTLVVSDGELTDSQEWSVAVHDVNRPPVIDIFYPSTDPTISEGESQEFNITYHDPDGDIVSVQWHLNGTPTVTTDYYTFVAANGSAGTYNITVTISDGFAQSSHEWTLTVHACIEIPIEGGEKATIEGNVTITNTLVTKNTLHFDASGSTGSTGWINVTFPMVNTTEIKVFINEAKLTPPPFPIITTNGTHYFIYFEFTLSTHSIDIQFGPSVPVGGVYIPINKLELLAPWIILASTIVSAIVITVIFVKLKKKAMNHRPIRLVSNDKS